MIWAYLAVAVAVGVIYSVFATGAEEDERSGWK